jgi:carboxyl-terminal processing protease
MGKSLKLAALVLLLIALIAAIVIIPVVTRISTPAALDKVDEAWQVILNDYVAKDKLDQNALSEGAIKGMIAALNDPYTAYYDAAEYRDISQRITEGGYVGIGAVMTINNGNLTVVSVLPDTPAEKAGIRAKDRVLEVDGNSTAGMSLDEAVLRIQGKAGTEVTLLVLHAGEENPETIVITREEITFFSVSTEILQGNIGLITVSYFSTRTGSEFTSGLEELKSKNVGGIILDLRDNPGGTLDAAVSVASQFLKDGIVLYALDNEGKKQTYDVKPGGLATELPLAVLVNGYSASGSEVVAGALQDYGKGVLIGTKTFGKGSINHWRQLSDGSAIYITIGRWYTPNGRQIEGNGLTPDIVVERTQQDIEQGKDPQLDRAIEYIKSQI